MNAVRVDGAAEPVSVGFRTDAIVGKARDENFPVALRLLPARVREDLVSVYGYARLVDDTGDLSQGDRLAQLDWLEEELDRALEDRATDPIVSRAGALAKRLHTGKKPFADLIEANRQDQKVTRYATYEELEHYCTLSANPVGRLVLAIFGVADPECMRLSDDVCTGLQLVEHWQDVGEDYRAGRVYLPAEDRLAFGVGEDAIATSSATPAFRRLMAFECSRARRLLSSGDDLTRRTLGWARVAISGFVGGGLAQLDAIERRGFDVFAGLAKATHPAVARRALRVWSHALGSPR
jgi:squalene synthase HpnC